MNIDFSKYFINVTVGMFNVKIYAKYCTTQIFYKIIWDCKNYIRDARSG